MRAWEVKLEIMTDQQIDRQTDMRAHFRLFHCFTSKNRESHYRDEMHAINSLFLSRLSVCHAMVKRTWSIPFTFEILMKIPPFFENNWQIRRRGEDAFFWWGAEQHIWLLFNFDWQQTVKNSYQLKNKAGWRCRFRVSTFSFRNHIFGYGLKNQNWVRDRTGKWSPKEYDSNQKIKLTIQKTGIWLSQVKWNTCWKDKNWRKWH